MSSIWDSIKSYDSSWVEKSSRYFSDEEKSVVVGVCVVTSGWGLSAMFGFPGGVRKFIPMEPSAQVTAGDKLNINDLKLVDLEYQGTDPKVTVRRVLRIRVQAVATHEVTFDNPFGI